MLLANEIADAIVRVKQPTSRPIREPLRRLERKRHRHIVAALLDEEPAVHTRVEIDAVSIKPRWRSGLQPAHFEPETSGSTRPARATAAHHAARPVAARPDVDQTVEKRAGGDDERAARQDVAVFHRQTDDATALDQNVARLSANIHSMLGCRPIAAATHCE